MSYVGYRIQFMADHLKFPEWINKAVLYLEVHQMVVKTEVARATVSAQHPENCRNISLQARQCSRVWPTALRRVQPGVAHHTGAALLRLRGFQ